MKILIFSPRNLNPIDATVVEIPPHSRTLKINNEYKYCQLPYTQFYFTDLTASYVYYEDKIYKRNQIPVTLTSSSEQSIKKCFPRPSIFPNIVSDNNMSLPMICWGKSLGKNFGDNISNEELISYFWNSSFVSQPGKIPVGPIQFMMLSKDIPHLTEYAKKFYLLQFMAYIGRFYVSGSF